jgi:hypothetical protein
MDEEWEHVPNLNRDGFRTAGAAGACAKLIDVHYEILLQLDTATISRRLMERETWADQSKDDVVV